MNAETRRRAYQLVLEWSARSPAAIALLDGFRALSYAQLGAAIEAAAAQLRSRGVAGGDRVLIVAENNVAAVVFLFAAQSLDAWPAIVNARMPAREIAQLRECADARLTVYAIEGSPASEAIARLEGAEVADGGPFGRVAYGAANANAAPEPVHRDGEHQVGLLIFTSGTTGTPKAVMWSHASLLRLGETLSRARRTGAANRYDGGTPLSHIMGVALLMNVVTAGASVNLVPRLDTAALAASIASAATTHLSFVPTVYARLLDYLTAHDIDVSGHRLQYISSGGAPLDPLLKRRVEALFGIPLVNGYGMTECAPGARTRHDSYSPAESIGFPEEGVEAKVVDGAGSERETGEIGELWLKSATAMLGYYRNPEATAAALRPGGWIATGDLARRLASGDIAIVGRAKEMIIRSGFNVYPAEVEAVLNGLAGVMQSGVVGRPAADGNEEVIAFVQPLPGHHLSGGALQEDLRELVAPYKRPARIVVLEALPLGPTGKIWKKRLAEMALAL